MRLDFDRFGGEVLRRNIRCQTEEQHDTVVKVFDSGAKGQCFKSQLSSKSLFPSPLAPLLYLTYGAGELVNIYDQAK